MPEGYPAIWVVGQYIYTAEKISFSLICEDIGQIYGLDIGQSHRNPESRVRIGDVHKYRWTDKYQDKWAYEPTDPIPSCEDPVGVWKAFCAQICLGHRGVLKPPTPESPIL